MPKIRRARKKLTVAERRRRRKAVARRQYLNTRHGTFENRLRSCLYARKKDAKKRGLDFTISIEDFPHQTHCAIFKTVAFKFDARRGDLDHSLSIDRIDATRGYTPDNVWLVCGRANRIKNDATLDELRAIVAAWEEKVNR